MTRDATASEEKSSRSYWGFVLWPVAVIVFYVLSVGPVWCLHENDLIGMKVSNLWAPVWRAVDGTPLQKPVVGYVLWWKERFHGDNLGASSAASRGDDTQETP